MNKEKLRQDYIQRINAATDYIEEHLDENITLEDVAKVAYFSPFHFHRIFKMFLGETVNSFVNRLRLERSAVYILRGYDYTLSEIAERNGFSSLSVFSRAFKKYYGVSASDMLKNVESNYSKICKVESKIGKKSFTVEDYICRVQKIYDVMKNKTNVEVKQMPELKVAYIRHIGEYQKITGVFERLIRWMNRTGNFGSDTKGVCVYHDDPKVTQQEQLRTSVAFTVGDEAKADGEVGILKVKPGKYAVGHFEVSKEEFEEAWTYMCAWTIENGYEASEGDYYEVYHNDYNTHPEKKFIVDICIPVR